MSCGPDVLDPAAYPYSMSGIIFDAGRYNGDPAPRIYLNDVKWSDGREFPLFYLRMPSRVAVFLEKYPYDGTLIRSDMNHLGGGQKLSAFFETGLVDTVFPPSAQPARVHVRLPPPVHPD